MRVGNRMTVVLFDKVWLKMTAVIFDKAWLKVEQRSVMQSKAWKEGNSKHSHDRAPSLIVCIVFQVSLVFGAFRDLAACAWWTYGHYVLVDVVMVDVVLF